jgi:hypothetical protein
MGRIRQTTPNSRNERLADITPLRTLFDAHDGHGVLAVAFSPDGKYLYTLGNGILLLIDAFLRA